MTKAQKAILDVVKGSGKHLTAEQIFFAVKEQLPGVALGTIYRNLNNFAEDRKIRRIRRADAPEFFDANMSLHNHIVCAKCGTIGDISIIGLDDFIRTQTGMGILSVDMTLGYICPECAG
ncbi:MAG: transcriptional repressor [Treponema sp.]|jgi:Fe2+ or Zn2+ uptake regulation protein|nr:transcriptional repressor [Treponema sp.]